jgi:hypothetical protein
MKPKDFVTEAKRLIREERERQVLVEGYTGHHDLREGHENLVMAAATYEIAPEHREEIPASWPWDRCYWKPTASEGTKGRMRELVKAGALYLAAKAVMERKGLETPLKQAVTEKAELMTELVSELLAALALEEAKGTLTRVYFEDKGQDFLWWDLDHEKKVVDCGPFQASVWEGCIVIDDSECGILPGDRLLINSPHVQELLRLDYAVHRIEERKVLNG